MQRRANKIGFSLGVFLFALFVSSANAQSWDKASVEKLLCRQWEIDYYLDNGVKSLDEDLAGYTMTFYQDYSAYFVDMDGKSKWSYDEKKHALIIDDPVNKIIQELTILKISDAKLVFQVSIDGNEMESHFFATEK